MVNFRFHLVSLIAVFLALGIGILMGSTVIDQVTVRTLHRQLDTITSQKRARDRQIDTLRTDVGRWGDFGDAARDRILAGRLSAVPVLVVAVKGVDTTVLGTLHTWLRQAGAVDEGTLWLTPKLALATAKEAQDLVAITADPGGSPDALRQAALGGLATALTTAPAPPSLGPAPPPGPTTTIAAASPVGQDLLVALARSGFVEYDPAGGTALALGQVPVSGTRLVVVSGAGSRVPDATGALVLARLLGQRAPASVVAAEAGSDDPGRRAVFVGDLRKDPDARQRVSTVDDLEAFYGEMALVFAIEDLGAGRVGHYGVGPGARLLPQPKQ